MRSNFTVISEDLSTRFPDDTRIESFSNCAVGWSETLLVRPDSEAWKAAEKWIAKLADYPVADEDHWSETENEEAYESAVEFVRCELPILRDHAEDVGGFICDAFEDQARWCSAGGWWPKINKRDTYTPAWEISADRDTVAAGIRAWRNYRRGLA